ncbi:MAG: alpha-glucuronidase family glycosyl hydrolase, partial [Eudoraea sp.]|uniref:alpha-glucuronidase family glycosyl hydrolase n=1 Tax=Eudoraea sp. TaxID=1979955 RepID=UPI003C70DB86
MFFVFALLSIAFSNSQTPTGYDLWLEYSEIREPTILSEYQNFTNSIFFSGGNSILLNAQKELVKGLNAMLGRESDVQDSPNL